MGKPESTQYDSNLNSWDSHVSTTPLTEPGLTTSELLDKINTVSGSSRNSKALLFKVWSVDQQYGHHLGAG